MNSDARAHAQAQALGAFFARLLDGLSFSLVMLVLRHTALEAVRRRLAP